VSFDVPEYTADVTGVGTVRLLEAMRELGLQARFYQASSSELFGKVFETPQTENTPFYPRSPYAAAKAFSFHITRNYREAYDIFAVNGILFNHESPRRGESFVTRKISRAVARIHKGQQDCLYLGNMDAKRDWGYAGDFVEAMWMMLNTEEPDDYVVCTGETHSVREFCDLAFGRVGIELSWKGEGVEEQGIDQNGRVLVKVDPRFFRPTEVDMLLGDATKAREKLGWEPRMSFEQLVHEMVDADLKTIEAQPSADAASA
jgi:GDPmannose 4,6-dehydratase